jgi:hypothetical protein
MLGLKFKNIKMNNNLINEEIKKMRMIMGYNRSKTLNENIEMISEITGAGATPPDGTTGGGTTGGGTTGGGTTGGGVTKTVYKVPSELKSVTDFQKWMVKNGFGSELGPMGVDGKYGRYTAAAFTKYKDEYLKQPLPDDGYNVPVDVEASDVQANSVTDPGNTNNAQRDIEKDGNDVLSGK